MTSMSWEGITALESPTIHSDRCQLGGKFGSRYHWEMACPPPLLRGPRRDGPILMVVSSTPARTTAAGCTETGRQNAPCNQVYSPPSTPLLPCWSRIEKWEKKKNVTSWKASRGPLSSLPANGFPREDLPFCWATGGAARVPEAVPSKRGHQLNARRQGQVPRR